MDWVIENWKTIAFVALIVSNILAALGLSKYAKILRVIITGVHDYVQDTGNTRVQTAIRKRSEKAGVEATLKPYVMKVKGAWKATEARKA